MKEDETRNGARQTTGGEKMTKKATKGTATAKKKAKPLSKRDILRNQEFRDRLEKQIKTAERNGRNINELYAWLGKRNPGDGDNIDNGKVRYSRMKNTIGIAGKGATRVDDVIVCGFFFGMNDVQMEEFTHGIIPGFLAKDPRDAFLLDCLMGEKEEVQEVKKDGRYDPEKINKMLKSQGLTPLFFGEGRDEEETVAENEAEKEEPKKKTAAKEKNSDGRSRVVDACYRQCYDVDKTNKMLAEEGYDGLSSLEVWAFKAFNVKK